MELVVGFAAIAALIWFVWKHRRPREELAGRTVHLDGDGTYSVDVSGESNYQDALDYIAGGKTVDGHELECTASVRREPNNPHDRNAIAVFIDNRQVGYIPRSMASRMAALMDRQKISVASADAIINGGWRRGKDDEGHYGVKLDIS